MQICLSLEYVYFHFVFAPNYYVDWHFQKLLNESHLVYIPFLF